LLETPTDVKIRDSPNLQWKSVFAFSYAKCGSVIHVKVLMKAQTFSIGSEEHFTLKWVNGREQNQQVSMLTDPTKNSMQVEVKKDPLQMDPVRVTKKHLKVRWLTWNIYHFSIYLWK